MYVIRARNVNGALRVGLDYLIRNGAKEETRNGLALVAPVPVMTVTDRPRECVLLSPVRDANPFFHMYEAIWMLAGRDDVKPLTEFVSNFAQYADGDVIHGAYGRRWRSHFGFDQLKEVIERLRKNSHDRQCVITMWDPSMGRVGCANDLFGDWKDRPCNTHIYLRVNNDVLDMTVCCRSNDAIWGAHGANAVHFSFLQQYLAAQLYVGVGCLYQLSNNYHAYVSELERLMRRACIQLNYMEMLPEALRSPPHEFASNQPQIFYGCGHDDEDIQMAVQMQDSGKWDKMRFYSAWFTETFAPAMVAHSFYKINEIGVALDYAKNIKSEDWRLACIEWLNRRRK